MEFDQLEVFGKAPPGDPGSAESAADEALDDSGAGLLR